MKLKFLLPAALSLLLAAVSCTSREANLAESNIEVFLKEGLGDSVNVDVQEYSRLYVLSSSDSLPKNMDKVQMENGEVHQWMIDYNNLYGTTVAIAFSGLDEKLLKKVIENDQTFRDLGENWTEYLMLGFYNLSKGDRKESYAACYVLNKDLEVHKAYSLANISGIYKLMKEDK